MIAFALSALLSSHAFAGELDGITVPDTINLGGKDLVLNGMGLREKYYIDIYVGALWLPTKTTSGTSAISLDAPKRLTMTFIYKHVTTEQMVDAFQEGLDAQPNGAAVKDKFATLESYMTDIDAGDVIEYDYVPDKGTTITVKGVNKGTIEGKDFMEALWSVYIGAHPATENLKTGLLGG